VPILGTRPVIPRVDAQTPPTIVCVTLRRRPIITGAMAAKNRRMAGNSKLRAAAPVSALGLGFGDTLSLSPAPVVVVLPGYRRTATLESVATDSPPLASSVKHRINSGKSL